MSTHELYRKQEKVVCQPHIFPFPHNPGQNSNMGVGVGMCPYPKFLLVKQGKYTHLLYFFCRWLSLISMTSVTHCQITVLYRLFIPFCTCYTCNLYYFFYFFQCSIQRLSTFKDRFIYLGISFILKVLRETVPLYSQGRSSLFGGSTSF